MSKEEKKRLKLEQKKKEKMQRIRLLALHDSISLHESCSQCLRYNSPTSVILQTVGNRAFSVAAAKTWNSLPSEVMSSATLSTFKHCLKLTFSLSCPGM